MGTSGSGKTTLMQICGGLLSPDKGRVTVAGHELAGLDDEALSAFRNETIGFVFQFFQLQSFYTAEENVALPLIFGNVPPAERRRRAREACPMLDWKIEPIIVPIKCLAVKCSGWPLLEQ